MSVFTTALVSLLVYAEEEPFYLTLDTPPAPVLDPVQAQATFRIAPGFQIELIAAEPLVEDPVTVAWDEHGILYAVEMRGFMPDAYGAGEDAPVGAVVRLHDDDDDGRMDRREVLLDKLVLPRGIAIVNEGLLVAEPPNLWLCPSVAADARTIDCSEKRRVSNYGDQPGSVEHAENGLLPALDNWLYNAKSERRMRFVDGELIVERTFFRGQWGITQDDDGRLFYNTNSNFLFGDSYDAQPVSNAGKRRAPGLSARVSQNDEVYASRINPGVNRAYVDGVLRPDGRLRRPTSASGMAVYRGQQFGEAHGDDVFVAEPAANAVVRLQLERDGLQQTARHMLYPDPKWGSVEFMTSTDERFRPVDVKVGPDGALYVIDMYRGIIQDHVFLTDELRAQALERELDKPLGMGRIWRISAQLPPEAPVPEGLLDQLDHPNGWVRDTAQRLLILADVGSRSIRRLATTGSEHQRVHSLWVLEGRGQLSRGTTRKALADRSPRVRLAALRAGRSRLSEKDLFRLLESEADPVIRHHATMYLVDHNDGSKTIDYLSDRISEGEDAFGRLAVQSAAAGAEINLMSTIVWSAEQEEETQLIADLAMQYLYTSAGDSGQLLSFALAQVSAGDIWFAEALLRGVLEVTREPDFERFVLPEEHPLFGVDDENLWPAIAGARRGFTWPGDELVADAKPLNAAQMQRLELGRTYFESRCATCHGSDGRGVAAIGPSLVESPYVIGPPETLVRIILDGLAGPIEVHGETWNAIMPGHRANKEFTEETASGVATYVRRAWGHGSSAVDPTLVSGLKAERTGALWDPAELEAQSVNWRYAAYEGRYGQLEFAYDGRDLLINSVYFNGVMSETREDHFHFKPRALDVEFLWEEGEVTGLRMRTETGGVVLPKGGQ